MSMPTETVDWVSHSAERVCAVLQVDAGHGLSQVEASRRLDAAGPNELREGKPRSLLRLWLNQLSDFMIIVLFAAALVSGLAGEPTDSLTILVIIFLNAAIGVIQEYRAERAMAALKQFSVAKTRVRRDGRELVVPTRTLVPGDIVLPEAGDRAPADIRLIEAHSLSAEEAALTGESHPVDKSAEPLGQGLALPIGERRNVLYKGTMVAGGRGVGVVVATGMNTELGRIAHLLDKALPAKTPLQQRLERFGTRLALAVLAICAVIFVTGLLRGEPALLMFLTAVSLAVAAIPEALPAVVTIALALGARTMVARGALIRRLPAVETLGSVTYICSDKTGTLTENRMRVEALHVNGATTSATLPAEAANEVQQLLLRAIALNNDAVLGADGSMIGDPTEIALVEAAQRAGIDPAALARQAPRCAELPFDAGRKAMTTFHRQDEGYVAYTKGSPEAVISGCTHEHRDGAVAPLDQRAVLAVAQQLAAQGARVLAVGYRKWPRLPAELAPALVERDLILLGLVAMVDPPRAEVPQAVATCIQAGITPVMITGDHPATALAIAERIGLARAGDPVLTGNELQALSAQQLQQVVKSVRVYARVTPEQKINLVNALQASGEFAAMTGDGVNDAPALKGANIGVAMGQKGTDVAREAADMVLLDDNFATIVGAVREGRRIYDNIRKFIKYTMTSNSGEIWTLFLAPFLGLPVPLLPIHILWINLMTDGVPGLALAAEQEERGLMTRPPRRPDESVFAHGMWQHILWIGLLIGGLSLFAQAWALHVGSPHGQTMAFTVLVLSQLVHSLAIRSERRSLFSIGVTSNRVLLGAVLASVAIQLWVIYHPWGNAVFKTAPLELGELALCLSLPWVVLVAVELEKWLARRGSIYQE